MSIKMPIKVYGNYIVSIIHDKTTVPPPPVARCCHTREGGYPTTISGVPVSEFSGWCCHTREGEYPTTISGVPVSEFSGWCCHTREGAGIQRF